MRRWPDLAVEKSSVTVRMMALCRALAEGSGGEQWIVVSPGQARQRPAAFIG
jgi:hypothetical protein